MKRRTELLLAVAILLPAGLYAFYAASLDWGFAHSSHIASLPIYQRGDADGHYRIETDGLQFSARVYGTDNRGEAIILLHGFPENAIMWEPLATAAASAGFRVLAFDQRGYSPGARPDGAANYTLDQLTQDVIDLADAVGFGQFHLVGHDWGSVVGWVVTQRHAARVQTWSAMAIPHTGLFLHAALHDEEQSQRSGYINLLRLPLLPEFFSMVNGQRNLQDFLARVPEAHKQRYLGLLREPGAMTAALNWYRALDVETLAQQDALMQPVTVPTLFIWGRDDPVVAASVIKRLPEFVDAPYRELVLDTGHSLIQTMPEAVSAAVLAHLQQTP